MITLLKKRPSGGGGVDVMYEKLFHGIPRRGGEYPSAIDYRLNHPQDRPLHLWKDVFRLSNFFCPGGEMVFSRSLFDSLELNDCDSESLVFDRPFDLEYDLSVGSFEFFGFADYRQQQKFLYSQEGDPALNVGREFVVVYSKCEWDFLKDKFGLNNSELQAQREMFESESELLKILGTDYIEQVGILDALNMIDGWLLSPHVFEKLKDEIHPYFFEFTHIR